MSILHPLLLDSWNIPPVPMSIKQQWASLGTDTRGLSPELCRTPCCAGRDLLTAAVSSHPQVQHVAIGAQNDVQWHHHGRNHNDLIQTAPSLSRHLQPSSHTISNSFWFLWIWRHCVLIFRPRHYLWMAKLIPASGWDLACILWYDTVRTEQDECMQKCNTVCMWKWMECTYVAPFKLAFEFHYV